MHPDGQPLPSPKKGKRWEYHFARAEEDQDTQTPANILGRDGWELVSTFPDSNDEVILFFFKRELQ